MSNEETTLNAPETTETAPVEEVVAETSKLSPDLVPALLSAAMQLAQAEGGDNEEATIARANEIFNDAQLDEPQTEAGTSCRSMAQVAITQAEPSGTPGKPKFDYDKLRDTTSLPACSEILKTIGELASDLPIPNTPTAEQEKASEEAYEKLSLATFEILNKYNIGMSEFKFIFDSMKAVISALEEIQMQQVVGHRHEVMSRLFGTKNPGTEKFDSNYATYADLKALLDKVRKDTGNNNDDYFNIVSGK